MEQFTVREYIVREMGFPGVLKQEIVDELVRCKDCKNHDWCSIEDMALNDETFFCKWGERKEYD